MILHIAGMILVLLILCTTAYLGNYFIGFLNKYWGFNLKCHDLRFWY